MPRTDVNKNTCKLKSNMLTCSRPCLIAASDGQSRYGLGHRVLLVFPGPLRLTGVNVSGWVACHRLVGKTPVTTVYRDVKILFSKYPDPVCLKIEFNNVVLYGLFRLMFLNQHREIGNRYYVYLTNTESKVKVETHYYHVTWSQKDVVQCFLIIL
jgi:hypothetical protein